MATPPLSSDEIRAAAEVHRDIAPEYKDAVIDSLMDRIDREIGARVEAHVAKAQPTTRHPVDAATLARQRAMLAGAGIGALVAGTPLTVFAYSMADGLGRSGWLAAIWLVVAVLFGAGAAGLRMSGAKPRSPGDPASCSRPGPASAPRPARGDHDQISYRCTGDR